jgi:protein PhnA
MSLFDTLTARAGGVCELCGAASGLEAVEVGPDSDGTEAMAALLCPVCAGQVAGSEEVDTGHWQCLSASMWSEHAPVQVLAWRMLDRLKGEGWASELLETLYLDEERLAWAKAGVVAPGLIHKDSNGAVLAAGDTVTLIKDLPVKGAGFTAKRGTAVRGIALVPDNPGQIEGRVEGQRIVILTEFVKKR